MRLNIFAQRPRTTHEGAPAAVLTAEQALRRSVLSCLLWENEFYEDGQSIADRIAALSMDVAPEVLADLASRFASNDQDVMKRLGEIVAAA